VTALVEELGYDKAEALAKESRATGKSLRQLAEEKYGIPGKRFDELVSPEAVNRLGSPEEGSSGQGVKGASEDEGTQVTPAAHRDLRPAERRQVLAAECAHAPAGFNRIRRSRDHD